MPGDPLDVQSGDVEAIRRLLPRIATAYARAGEARASDDFVAGFIRGLGRRPKVRRQAWAAVIAATMAIALAAFQAGRLSAAPRPAHVIPSAPLGGGSEMDPERTGAPSVREAVDPGDGNHDACSSEPASCEAVMTGGAPFDPSSFPPIGFGVPDPSTGLDGPACSGPCETPPPRTVSRGTGIGGQATWWNSFGSGYYAAIRPDLGHKGDLAVVCGGDPFHCRTVEIITTCLCLGPGSGRLIDLSLDTFVDFAPPGIDRHHRPRTPGWQGTIHVVVQVIER